MKAVIWTDVFQTGIMLAGLLAAIIQVCLLLYVIQVYII